MNVSTGTSRSSSRCRASIELKENEPGETLARISYVSSETGESYVSNFTCGIVAQQLNGSPFVDEHGMRIPRPRNRTGYSQCVHANGDGHCCLWIVSGNYHRRIDRRVETKMIFPNRQRVSRATHSASAERSLCRSDDIPAPAKHYRRARNSVPDRLNCDRRERGAVCGGERGGFAPKTLLR